MICSICRKNEVNLNCKPRNQHMKLCSECCKQYRSWDLCNTECNSFSFEKSNAPIAKGIEITRVSDGHTHKFVEDVFLPNIFSQLYCEVSLCQINIFNVNHIEIDLEFKIKELNKSYQETYYKDRWKIKENGEGFRGLVPIFQLYTFENGSTKVLANSYSVDGHPYSKHAISSFHYNTWLPFSTAKSERINVKEMQDFEQDVITARVIDGECIFGKNDTVWAELSIDKVYKFSLSIFYSDLQIDRQSQRIKIPFGLFFPFKLVNYLDYSITYSDEIEVDEESKCLLIVPRKQRHEQLFLTPLEGNMSHINGGGHVKLPFGDIEKSFHYDRYSVFLHDLCVRVEDGFAVNSCVTGFPLMTGVYTSMKRLYDNKYAPANVSLINSSSSVRRVKIKSKIRGLSKKFELNLNLKPHEYKTIPIMPILDIDRISSISEITDKSLEIDVYEKGNRIYSETHEILVHPVDSFIYNLQDQGLSYKTYLYQLLACYSTPHIKEIERIVSEASKMTGSILGTLSNNFEKIMKELEAIYNILGENITYVTRSFNFSLDNLSGTQRISLPSKTLELKSGNCIDLSLLLASAYEACKHEVDIVLIPGHAFLAVKVTNMWIYIESTCLGKKDFKTALEIGNKQYSDNFSTHNQPTKKDARIISIKIARESKILPFE